MWDLTDEERAVLHCQSPRCGRSLLEVGVEQVYVGMRVIIPYHIYQDGTTERGEEFSRREDDSYTAYACGYCRNWLSEATGTAFVQMLRKANWYHEGRVPPHQCWG